MLTLLLSRFKLRNRIFLGYVFPIVFDLAIVLLVLYGFSHFKDRTNYLFTLSSQQEQVSNMANRTVALQGAVQTYLDNGSSYLTRDVERVAEQLSNEIQLSHLENKGALTANLQDYMNTFEHVVQSRTELNDLINEQLPNYSLVFQQGLADSLDRDLAQALIYRSVRIEKLALLYFIRKDYRLVEEALSLLKSIREILEQEAGIRPLAMKPLTLKLNQFEQVVIQAMTKTRTFLALVSTVMAGHASEILYVMDNNHKLTTLLYQQEKDNLRDLLNQFLWGLMIVLLTILSISMLVSFFVAGTITRPIQELTRYYAQISNRQMDDTLPKQPEYNAQDEIADLYKVLNELMSYQQQAIMMQRNESIGHMTRQVSHEFKNLMTPIIGFSDVLKHQIKDETAIQTLNNIQDIAHQAVDLIRDMQIYTGEFGSEQKSEDVQCDIQHELDKNLKLIRAAVPSKIKLDVKNNISASGKVRLSRTAITQILMNIVQNAIHALESTSQPAITLVADEIGLNKIRIKICNNGSAIPESVLIKMFDPFYTTKQASKGTGMGLSVVIGFVEKAGGEINVTSDNEQTCFDIILPTF